MADVKETIGALARQVADDLGVELDEVELLGRGRKTLLRITLYRAGGLTVGDCETYSRDISALLDVEDVIDGPYTLEVTSPGLNRPLVSQRDFNRHSGELVRVTLKEKVGGTSALLGRIVEAGPDGVLIEVEGEDVDVKYGNIFKAMLEIEIK